MLGGELTGDGFPVMNLTAGVQSPNTASNTERAAPSIVPQLQNNSRVRCDGTTRESDNTDDYTCPTTLHAPSLAMVYSPKQCWRNLFDPTTGLSRGTIFAELSMPLEVVSHNGCKEVRNRRPF